MRSVRVTAYFHHNSRPVNLDGLSQLLTPDVVVDYPSGRFIGLDGYMKHQVSVSRAHVRAGKPQHHD